MLSIEYAAIGNNIYCTLEHTDECWNNDFSNAVLLLPQTVNQLSWRTGKSSIEK
jgi:hypothetical protein